jgi:zinc protease
MNMKPMKRLSILFFALVFSVACATQEQATLQTEQRGVPVDVEGLTYPELNPYQIPEIETFELDNGIKFYLVEDDEVPLINLNMIVSAGSFMIPDEKEGLAGIMANVIRNGGSEAYPETELNQMLEDRAARIEFGMGFTSGSVTLNALNEDFYDLLPVLLDVMMNPLLPQEKIDLAITQSRSGISRRNDNAQQIGFREFGRLIYGEDSPQGRMMEHWTLDAITREDLAEFHKKAYTGENLMIGLVGDFKVEEIKPILEEIFSDIPAGEKNEIELPEVDYTFDSSIHFVDKRDVNQSVILMGHIGGLRDNPDYAALQAMNEVLSGGSSGRLFQNVRSDQGLAYAVFGNYGSSALYPGQFYAGVFTQSSTTAEAIKSVRNEMIKLQEEPVSQEELDDTRNSILNSLVFRYDSRSRVLRERMSNEYLGLPANAFESYIEELQTLTPADIQRVASQYMRPDEMRILVVGHGGEIGDQLNEFGNVQEVDIEIRRSLEEEEVVSGDVAGGAEWLNKMSGAILQNGNMEGTFKQEGVVELNSPMGAVSLTRNEEINFKENTFLIEMLNTPQGDITFNISGNQGTASLGGQEFPLQPAQIQQQLGEYKVHYLNILANRDEFSVDMMGTEEVNGEDTILLRVRGDKTLNFFLNMNTALPVKMSYEEFNPQMGGDVLVEMYYNQWTVSDGVAVAYEVVSKVAGEDQATVRISDHSIE